MLRPAELARADVDVIRREVFTSATFYVTNITQARDSACVYSMPACSARPWCIVHQHMRQSPAVPVATASCEPEEPEAQVAWVRCGAHRRASRIL